MPFYRVVITDEDGATREKIVEADSIAEARVKAKRGEESGSEILSLPQEIASDPRGVTASPEDIAATTYQRPEEYKDTSFLQTDVLPGQFADFINPDLVDPTIIGADPTIGGDFADTRDLTKERVDETNRLAAKLEAIESEVGSAQEAAGTESPTGFLQTGTERARMLEGATPFGVFLEELANQGLSGAQGIARRFLMDQYAPQAASYQAAQLLPMMMSGRSTLPFNIGSGPMAEGGTYLSGEQQEALRNALTRQFTGDYGDRSPEEIGILKAEDQALIDANTPTFASYLADSFKGGGRAAGLRMGEQLRDIANLTLGDASTPLAKHYLNPTTAEDAGMLFNMAQEANRARFSPLIQGAVQRSLPTLGEVFANFARESVPAIGEDVGSAPIPNFASFLSQRGFF